MWLFVFPPGLNADTEVEKVMQTLRRARPTAGPPLRVAPLTDRAAYGKALELAQERLVGEVAHEAVWLHSIDRAEVGIRVKQGGVVSDQVHAIRVVQILLS